MKSRRYKIVFRVLVAVVSIQLLVGTVAAIYWFDFPNCFHDKPASNQPEYLGQTPESMACKPQIVSVMSSSEIILKLPAVGAREVIQNYIADPEEKVLECVYSTDRGGILTLFFRLHEGQWVSFASEYLPAGWAY